MAVLEQVSDSEIVIRNSALRWTAAWAGFFLVLFIPAVLCLALSANNDPTNVAMNVPVWIGVLLLAMAIIAGLLMLPFTIVTTTRMDKHSDTFEQEHGVLNCVPCTVCLPAVSLSLSMIERVDVEGFDPNDDVDFDVLGVDDYSTSDSGDEDLEPALRPYSNIGKPRAQVVVHTKYESVPVTAVTSGAQSCLPCREPRMTAREIKYKLKEFLGLDIDPLDPPSPGGPGAGARERPELRNSMRDGALDHGWAAGGGADAVTPIDPIAEEEAPPPRPDGRRRPSLHALPPTVKAPAPPGQGSPELGEEGRNRRHHHHNHHHHSHTDSPRDKDDRKKKKDRDRERQPEAAADVRGAVPARAVADLDEMDFPEEMRNFIEIPPALRPPAPANEALRLNPSGRPVLAEVEARAVPVQEIQSLPPWPAKIRSAEEQAEEDRLAEEEERRRREKKWPSKKKGETEEERAARKAAKKEAKKEETPEEREERKKIKAEKKERRKTRDAAKGGKTPRSDED